MPETPAIIYTKTDEAPMLATYSFLPVLEKYAEKAGVPVALKDISLASRILSQFPDYLGEGQKHSDSLAVLGQMAKTPEANIIKLPNISASIPQLKACIKELQQKGFDLPDYVDHPANEKEKDAKARYDKVKGSAVNPVLREGNSDRRAPKAVKEYAKKNPHSMGEWRADSKTNVVSMKENDFFGNEKSHTFAKNGSLKIVLETDKGESKVLKEKLDILSGEVCDATFMSASSLRAFLKEQIAEAKKQDVLFSLHMKATMMKVSDPIIFGHAVQAYFQPVFEKHSELLEKIGFSANSGIADLYSRLDKLDDADRQKIQASLNEALEQGPAMAMVNSDKGIGNLHVPSDVIIDASMPAAIRAGGKMWGPDGSTADTLAVIPDRSYSSVYQATIDFCKKHGAFDPTKMGSVANVGLMAQKAEEYGSHDKTWEIPESGTVKVYDQDEKLIFEHRCEAGDIWRMCQVKDAPIRDWVSLAVRRARATATPAIFWLDKNRAHDSELIKKVESYLKEEDTEGLDIRIMAPFEACQFSLEQIAEGKDCISVTGNVLRDYLTDLFPILEVGTSAKMLSIVPLMNGGGLFETGAGGSAPKHVQQFTEEGHLRWDSLGEFLALAVSLQHFGEKNDNPSAILLGKTLDDATTKFLMENKSPSRKCGELDNRGSHFYLSLYWAEALAEQKEAAELATNFASHLEKLKTSEDQIIAELKEAQGKAVDIGGYYLPDEQKVSAAMRASKTWNALLESF